MDFKMKIEIDEETNEHFLTFLDKDDRDKKSRFLKIIKANGINVITMSINENVNKATDSQKGLFKAFLILISDYTGHHQNEVRDSIYRELSINQSEVDKYSKHDYTEFIEKIYEYCSHNIGILVEMENGKLILRIPEND